MIRRWWTRWLIKEGIIEPPVQPHKRITQCGMIDCKGPWI